MRGVVALLCLVAGCELLPEPPPIEAIVARPSTPDAAQPDVPMAARRYRDIVISNARVTWGMSAPVAMFGAQIQQESGWNPDAKSPVGAEGLTQFMPSTADWLSQRYADLGPAQPFDPSWSIRALLTYDKYLYDRVAGAHSECDRHAFELSGYNSGEGWVKRDRVAATAAGRDGSIYWGEVETVNAGRSAAAWNESRGYPRRIIRVLQPSYRSWGLLVCEG